MQHKRIATVIGMYGSEVKSLSSASNMRLSLLATGIPSYDMIVLMICHTRILYTQMQRKPKRFIPDIATLKC